MGTRRMAAMAAAAVVVGGWLGSAAAGETAVHLKSGYFQWSEKIAGSDFVKERGAMTALALSRTDSVSAVSFREVVEVWGGGLDYDGHDITNTTVLKSDTVYLGTREEVSAAVELPVAPGVGIGPVIGIGHKFWLRSRSGEDWNVVYGRFGATGGYASGGHRMTISGGITLPVYSRSHVNLGTSGYEDVVTHPKGEPSVYGEVLLRRSSWSVGISYEEMNFAESAKVTARPTSPTRNGVAVINSLAFQPDSRSSMVGLSVAYHF